jgi:hypothetical protein
VTRYEMRKKLIYFVNTVPDAFYKPLFIISSKYDNYKEMLDSNRKNMKFIHKWSRLCDGCKKRFMMDELVFYHVPELVKIQKRCKKCYNKLIHPAAPDKL